MQTSIGGPGLTDIQRLLQIMAALRDPHSGCPWDQQQNFKTIAPYTIEESYEVADAIERGNMNDLKDELGDLLFQVVFHAQMASEQGGFTFNDVVTAICEKMTRRHPHVFAGASIADADAQTKAWDEMKRAEKGINGAQPQGYLDDVPRGLPEWTRANKLQKSAARSGFEWPNAEPVFEKLLEEVAELKEAAALASDDRQARVEEELGDVLFVATNLARHLKVDFGASLRGANLKFERRFRAMECLANERGAQIDQLSLSQQEELWNAVKIQERASSVGKSSGG